jgi:hypothetical protein
MRRNQPVKTATTAELDELAVKSGKNSDYFPELANLQVSSLSKPVRLSANL